MSDCNMPPNFDKVELPENLGAYRAWRSFFNKLIDCGLGEGLKIDNGTHSDDMNIRRWAKKMHVPICIHMRNKAMFVVSPMTKGGEMARPPKFQYCVAPTMPIASVYSPSERVGGDK